MDETPAPRTSVLIVARNCAEPLRRTVASVLASTNRETLEVVVVDNGSRDGTGEAESEFPDIVMLRMPKNFGYTRAANIGIRTAKGELILLTRPGVEFAPDAIQRLVAELDGDPAVGAVCPDVPGDFALPTAADLRAHWKSGAPLPFPAGTPMLVRKNFLAGMRFLDQRFGDFGWELDLLRQLATAGKRVYSLPEAQAAIPAVAAASDAMSSVDTANGAAAWLGKHHSFAAGLQFRAAAILTSLAGLLTSPIYNGRRLAGLVSGTIIDGNQPGAES